jgi:DNA-binding NarL/FixJ family response regulator
VVGDLRRREFREARAAMDACGLVVEAADVTAACAVVAGGEYAFDLIVLAATYPGQFSAEAVERLRRLAPLSRVVGLLGTWCEGEMRSGHPHAGAIRVYWHQWIPRLGRESGRWDDGVRCSWGLPVTAGEEERVLALAEEPFPRRSGLIAVCSDEFAMQDWLCAACRRAGYAATWLRLEDTPPVEKSVAAIFDASDQPHEQYEHLRRFAAGMHPAPVVALLGFPRVEDRAWALAAGAASVLAKPLFVQDLLWELDRVTAPIPGSLDGLDR